MQSAQDNFTNKNYKLWFFRYSSARNPQSPFHARMVIMVIPMYGKACIDLIYQYMPQLYLHISDFVLESIEPV